LLERRLGYHPKMKLKWSYITEIKYSESSRDVGKRKWSFNRPVAIYSMKIKMAYISVSCLGKTHWLIGNEKNSGNLSRSTNPSCLLLQALSLLPNFGAAPSSCLVLLPISDFKIWFSFPNFPLHRVSKRSSYSLFL
jgi:hypothetical protein